MYLNAETARYLFRIVSIKYLREHKDAIFGPSLLGDQYRLIKTDTLSVKNIDDIVLWTKEHYTSYRHIKDMNPWIMGNILPEGDREILMSR